MKGEKKMADKTTENKEKTTQEQPTKKVENKIVEQAKTYNATEVEKLVAEASKKAAEDAVKAYIASNPTPIQPIIQVAKEEYVTIMYIGLMAKGTAVSLKWGQITYSGGTIDVPKKDFMQGIGSPLVDALLRKRELIVINGLTEEEMQRFGIAYNKDDILTQRQFAKLLDYKSEEIIAIFSKLCEQHQRIVAGVYFSAYFEKNDNRINPETVKALNTISKQYDKDGMFKPILEDIGRKFAE